MKKCMFVQRSGREEVGLRGGEGRGGLGWLRTSRLRKTCTTREGSEGLSLF